MVQITNVFDRALALLVSQFRGEKANGELTNFQKLIKCLAQPFQDLENVKWQLKTERSLSTAIGAQLDEIGEILGLPRLPGESDDDYRERLEFQVFINTTSGTPEETMAILAFLTNATYTNYFQMGIAAYQLETNGLKFPNPPNDLNEAIFRASPAGVQYAPIVATYNAPISFEFSDDLMDEPFFVAANTAQPTELKNLEVAPYNSIIYVANGAAGNNLGDGGFEELGFPLATAGQLSELIQINGNSPPVRF